ncbi:MAG TPA: glycosyltransferase family 87 protein [Solirubrobacteraceae bacterium]|nr:glycosyltransferase family 87 protein [Solirubrobacteraceae bacterium]
MSAVVASARGPRPARERLSWLVAGVLRLLVVPSLLLCGVALAWVAVTVHTGNLLYDFRGGLYDAGLAILQGRDPYRAQFIAHQAAIMRAGGVALGETALRPFSVPVYPAAANVAIVPLSLLPLWLAGSLYTVGSVAAMLGGLWLLGVRDRRCLALASVSWPFLYGLYLGNVGPLLVLGAGAAWRWRERVWPSALAVASLVALKIFPWPLAVWLWICGRRRAACLAAVLCAALTLSAWAAIDFHGLLQYPSMLSNVSYLQEGRADSLVTGLLVAGVAPSAATVVALVAAAGLLLVAWRALRLPGGEARALGLSVIAALTGTPIVWEHYMVLIFIPIAVISPRWSRLWLAPALLPILELLSPAVIPADTGGLPYSPEALRGVLPWLALQGLLAVMLSTTPAQRSRWRAAVRGRRPRRPSSVALGAR